MKLTPGNDTDDGQENGDNDEIIEVKANKKRVRRTVQWKPIPEANNVPIVEVKFYIVMQEKWEKRKSETSKTGVKKDKYTCLKSAACQAALYMVHLGMAMVTLLRNEFDHDREQQETGIDQPTKVIITLLLNFFFSGRRNVVNFWVCCSGKQKSYTKQKQDLPNNFFTISARS